mmetsp:Transcript_79276/g.138432  ORF Transcript_79276/g.138432 Transcript_79276/m.138432 type:complete len:134 (+) Transcript_79276:1-402(+)
MGLTYLTATTSFADLILNALSLSFVFDIDQQLFDCFLPQKMESRIETMKIMCPPDASLSGLAREEVQDYVATKQAYGRSLVIWLSAHAITYLWSWIQPVLPGFERDVSAVCEAYLGNAKKIHCSMFDRNCFPK